MTETGDFSRPQPPDGGTGHWRDIIIALLAVGIIFYVWIGDPGIEMPLYLSGVCVLTVLSFKSPSVACVLFIIFSFLRLHEVFPVLAPFRIPQLLAQLSIIVVFWHMVLARSIPVFWTRELTIFAVFFLLVTVSVFTATNREQSYAMWADVFVKVGIIVLILTWATRSAGDFQLIARLLTIAGTAVAAVAIYNRLNGIDLVEGTRVTIGRAAGSVLGDPNDLALVLLFPLGFAAALIMGRVNALDRLLGLVSCGTVFLAILYTQSRGGLLGVAAVCAVLASRFVKNRAVLIAIGVVAVLGLFAVAGISGRSSGGAGQGIDESSQGRLNAWETAFNMAKRRPLRGVGIGNYVENYRTYTPEWDGSNHAVHSTWFLILAEVGFPGLIVFVVLVGATGLVSWRCLQMAFEEEVDPRLQTAALALSSSFAGFCVSGTFLTQGFTWPFYTIFALTLALHHVLTRERELRPFAPEMLLPPRRPSPAARP